MTLPLRSKLAGFVYVYVLVFVSNAFDLRCIFSDDKGQEFVDYKQ